MFSSSTYKTDLLADKQKKMGGGVKEGDCDLKKNVWQNYHNGLGVFSSSMYMTGLWADKQNKKNKKQKIIGGGGGMPPCPIPPPPHHGTAPDHINIT